MQTLTPGRGIELVNRRERQRCAVDRPSPAIARITTGTLQLGDRVLQPARTTIGNAGETVDLTGHAGTLLLRNTGAVTEGAGRQP